MTEMMIQEHESCKKQESSQKEKCQFI